MARESPERPTPNAERPPGEASTWPVRRREARALGDAVDTLLRNMGGRGRQGRIERQWSEAVGPKAAAHTRVAAFQGMVLRIEVDSSALLHELVAFRRADLLERLRSGDRPLLVRDVRFELGGR